MSELFSDNGAKFSDDRKYRYALWRIWDKDKPLVMFIGLNPSTANENDTPQGNDNTITKVKKISANNGYGGFYMVNLFPQVTPFPWELENSVIESKGLGVINDITIWSLSKKCKDIVFAWGNFKQATEKAKRYISMYPNSLCLHINKNGSPKHPLYCKDDSILKPYKS